MRQFRLINGNGETFDLMRKDAFFHAPGGLGFDREIESMMAGYEFVELRDDLAQKQITGEMVFLGYEQYKEFISFIGVKPLRLEYKPLNQWHRIRVKVQRIGKTEISRVGRLICAIDFLAFSTWYNVLNYETVPEEEPEYENLMVRGTAFYAEDDGTYQWTIGASTDADDVVKRFLNGNTAPSMNTVPVQLPGFTGDTYQLTAGDYFFKAIGKRQGVRSYFKVKPLVKTASGNPIQIQDAIEVAPNSLEVSVSPKQDGTPWIGSETDTDPYNFRAMPSIAAGANREYDKLIGASVAWNQLMPTAYKDFSSFTFSAETTYNYVAYQPAANEIQLKSGHVYIASVFIERTIAGNNELQIIPWNRHSGGQVSYTGIMELANGASNGRVIGIFTANENGYIDRISFNNYNGKRKFEAGDSVAYSDLFLIDLTQMFGSTVANAMTVDLFKKMFPKPYYAYDAGSIQSVSVSEKVTTGKNTFDEDTAYSSYRTGTNAFTGRAGTINALLNYIPSRLVGKEITVSVKFTAIGSTNAYVRVVNGGTAITGTVRTSSSLGVSSVTFTPISTSDYWHISFASGADANNSFCDIQVEIGSTATAYEAYAANTYALDDTELRGLFSIVDGELVADGDEYPSSGSGTQKYDIVDLGTMNWSADPGRPGVFYSYTIYETCKTGGKLICPQYLWRNEGVPSAADLHTADNTISAQPSYGGGYIFVIDTSHASDTGSDFKTAMNGVYLVYELATPTTISLDPFTNPQIVDPNGTESYTDAGVAAGTRDVAIPVGHSSSYALQVPITGTDEISVNVTGTNVWDETTELGTLNTTTGAEVPSTTVLRSMFIPVFPSTSYYAHFGYNSNMWTLFYDNNKNVISGWATGKAQSNNASNIGESAFSTPPGCAYIRFYLVAGYGTTYQDDISINYPATDHDYHAHQGATYTHTLSPTMYGGSVDLVSGEETAEMASVDLGTLTWNYSANRNGYFYTQLPGMKLNGTLYCTAYPFIGIRPSTYSTDKVLALESASDTYIDIHDTSYSNANDLKATLNGIMLVYELATPTTASGTPDGVTLLKGENVISTDGDSIDLSYDAYPNSRLVLDVYGELAPDPDSAADTQIVSNFTVYEDQEVQFYMDQEDIPFDYSVEAFLAAGSYPANKVYGYPYPYSYSGSVNGEMDVFNGSTVAGYCRLTIQGPVEDPIWAVYQNGQLLQRGKITATIPEGHVLVVDSSPTELEISERTLDGELVANRYADSDFSTVRFITIPPGSSKVVVTQTGDEPITAYLEVDELEATV